MSNSLLSKKRAGEIEDLVNEIMKNLTDTEPVDLLINIAEKEGITLKQADLREMSGVLKKEKEGWAIIVNKNDPQSRQIFTVAHELGHYFLHKNKRDEFIDGIYFGREENTKYHRDEVEANEFAGNLIMPRKLIQEALGSKKSLSRRMVELLADRFKVSTIAMQTRLKNLDYNLK